MAILAAVVLYASFILSTTVYAIATISTSGAKLFTSDGNQFYIKGVAYQGTPNDPLVDNTQCQADAALMQTLGTNSIRVYHVDPSQDHDACMQTFEDAGIYVWLDLDTFTTYITQEQPTWNSFQYSMYAQVMDVFVGYDNLGGFWIANEAINTAAGSGAAPYIKAAIADMKAYRDSKGYRSVPIGYSAADIAELRPMLQFYLACGDDDSQTVDFFGLNSYEWCAINTFNGSGYDVLQQEAATGGIPIFFSETGCNVGGPRTFDDQDAILGPDMADTWSGAIIYEWVQETNDYGLISYANDGALHGTPTAIAPDFQNLMNHWKTLSPTGVSKSAYTNMMTISHPPCPISTAGGWLVNGNVALPTLGIAAVTSSGTAMAAAETAHTSSGMPAFSLSSGSDTTSSPPLNPTSSSLVMLSTTSTVSSSSITSSTTVLSSSETTAVSTASAAISFKSGVSSAGSLPRWISPGLVVTVMHCLFYILIVDIR